MTAKRDTATPANLSTLVRRALGEAISGTFDQMIWAADELSKALVRHPDHAERLHQSHPLLKSNADLDLMRVEHVYRAHCREILDRIASRQDTRPGTAAEVCSALCGASLKAPMQSAAVGLYIRMWKAAGFPDPSDISHASELHEAQEKSVADEAETISRRRLSIADRFLNKPRP